MDDIITQLQYEVLDSGQDTLTILRKAYLISKKLDLRDFGNWISCELNGYKTNDKLPDYRKIDGLIRFNNPYQGWRPAMFEDSAMERSLSVYYARESIPKIIDLSSQAGQLSVPIPTEIALKLIKNSDAPMFFEFAIFLDKSSIRNIVDIVRTKILEWAILLEQSGIQGEGMKFSKDEITNAQNSSIVYYTNNFYASVDDTQIQQGASDSKQNSKI